MMSVKNILFIRTEMIHW